MSELENIENSQEVEVIPTDNTQEELQENVEETITVPEDNTAEIEAEQERLRREHEEYLNSFPETTVWYRDLLVNGNVKSLGTVVRDPHIAEQWGFLDNHFDESELTYIGTKECGIWYLKGYEKPDETEAEIIRKKVTEIENNVQELIDSTAHQKGYDNGFTCCSYIGSTDSIFHAEAVAFSTWRDQVWRKCYDILGQVQAGEIDYKIVDYDYVLERLPVFTWPE